MTISPTVLQAAVALEKHRRACRDNFTRFVEEVARNEEGDPITLADIHKQWHRHLDFCWSNNYHAMLWAPMGMGKSSSLVVPLTSWLIGRNQQVRIKIVCNSDPQAIQRVSAVRSLLESPAYKRTFPEVRSGPKWSDREFTVIRKPGPIDPTLQARGVNTIGVGGRVDVLIFDDAIDDKNSAEAASRRKIQHLIESKWITRKDSDQSKVLWIATPWHVDDASHTFRGTKGWCTLIHSVNADNTAINQEIYGVPSGMRYPYGPDATLLIP